MWSDIGGDIGVILQVVEEKELEITYSGWEINPTKKSVTARHRCNNLDGG